MAIGALIVFFIILVIGLKFDKRKPSRESDQSPDHTGRLEDFWSEIEQSDRVPDRFDEAKVLITDSQEDDFNAEALSRYSEGAFQREIQLKYAESLSRYEKIPENVSENKENVFSEHQTPREHPLVDFDLRKAVLYSEVLKPKF